MIELSKQQGAKTAALSRLAGRELKASELVSEMKRDGIKGNDAVGAIIQLRNEKKVSVVEAKPYSGLSSYAWSPYSLWFWAALCAVIASVSLVFVSSGVALYARYVFGSALVLFLPGYALIEALYPKRGGGSQVERVGLVKAEMDDDLTRFALSIGLSLAIVPLTGLVLNYTPFGIRLLPVTISIAGLTVAFLLLALVRKHAYYKLAKGIL